MNVIFLISCQDRPGIVAGFSDRLFTATANILTLEQHTENGWFFMRVEAEHSLATADWENLQADIQQLAKQFDAQLQIYDQAQPARVALLVTNQAACPQELLSRYKAGELNCEIPLVIGNSDNLADLAAMYGVDFKHVSYDDGVEAAEQAILQHLQAAGINFVILARFMKVLSADFVSQFPERIINIHHGFLPAFKGSKPYHQAWERGVKVIGATSHFVTADLDDGPIISQDVMTVTHQHSAAAMVQAGQDIERRVLLQATKALLDHKIMLHNSRTIVFN